MRARLARWRFSLSSAGECCQQRRPSLALGHTARPRHRGGPAHICPATALPGSPLRGSSMVRGDLFRTLGRGRPPGGSITAASSSRPLEGRGSEIGARLLRRGSAGGREDVRERGAPLGASACDRSMPRHCWGPGPRRRPLLNIPWCCACPQDSSPALQQTEPHIVEAAAALSFHQTASRCTLVNIKPGEMQVPCASMWKYEDCPGGRAWA